MNHFVLVLDEWPLALCFQKPEEKLTVFKLCVRVFLVFATSPAPAPMSALSSTSAPSLTLKPLDEDITSGYLFTQVLTTVLHEHSHSPMLSFLAATVITQK